MAEDNKNKQMDNTEETPEGSSEQSSKATHGEGKDNDNDFDKDNDNTEEM